MPYRIPTFLFGDDPTKVQQSTFSWLRMGNQIGHVHDRVRRTRASKGSGTCFDSRASCQWWFFSRVARHTACAGSSPPPGRSAGWTSTPRRTTRASGCTRLKNSLRRPDSPRRHSCIARARDQSPARKRATCLSKQQQRRSFASPAIYNRAAVPSSSTGTGRRRVTIVVH
jgi:hypothetical protein